MAYVNSGLEDAVHDLENSFNEGADAVVFEGHDYTQLDQTLTHIRNLYPTQILGVNFLGPDTNLYTFKETFALAQKHHLQIAWTDFSGVDLIHEAAEVSLQSILKEKPHDVFYVSGIHMKYSTLIDTQKPVELSALQAMGWVDGVVMTGLKTAEPANPELVQRVRSQTGNYPLGLASGVSVENIDSLLNFIDFALVNSSIAGENHRIDSHKVKQLRSCMQ